MDQGFQFLCKAEVRRLLSLMIVTIGLVLVIQYFEFPTSRSLSLFSVANATNFFPSKSPSFSSPIPYTVNESKEMEDSIHCLGETSAANRSEDHLEIYKSSILDEGKSVIRGSETERAMAPIIFSEETAMALAPDISFINITRDLASDSDASSTFSDKKGLRLLPFSSSSTSRASATRQKSRKPPSSVVSISQMNDLLSKSHASSYSARPKQLSEIDQQMMFVRSQIETAAGIVNDSVLYDPIYHNVSMFKRSYELMEKMLKVYIYPDGEKPIFHQPLLEGIYSSEGWFMKHMEGNEKFVTKDPSKAHLFYIPFSSRLLELTLYVRNSHSRNNLIQFMKNYVDMIAKKYSFWNRTGGADHFVAACHDWAPAETRGRMLNCIRALCNADIRVGFRIGKDVSLPETYVRAAQKPLKNLEGSPPSERSILAFFAGNIHGYVRPILLKYWENKDPDMKIFGQMPRVKGNVNYIQHMKSSKYCICPRGHEVNSPRIVEAIFYECVPVIISDNYVPPFFEVLDWESFAVFVLENDIPNLKSILHSIPLERYLEMHRRVKKVQQHFLWHLEPVKYDLFHMILHSVWHNRAFQM